MLTSLDWLVIVFMGLTALTLLSLCLMFLLKNKTAKRVFFYIVAVLGLYISSIALRIGLGGWFTAQIFFGILTVIMSVGAIVLELIGKNNEKYSKIAHILAAVSLVVGFVNTIL